MPLQQYGTGQSSQCRQVSQEKGGLLRPSRRGGQQWPPVQDRALEDGNLEVALGKSHGAL